MNHWLLRVGDGSNFMNSSNKKIWGIQSKSNNSFLEKIKKNDILWFITNKSNGKILAMANYKSHNKRELGILINITQSNEELGWVDYECDTEIHYDNLYNLEKCNLLTNLKGMRSVRKYEKEKIDLDLDEEYKNIVKYANIINKF